MKLNLVILQGHYVVLDHASKSIVVAFRGTFHIKDALTDLVATYEPFLDGFAHWYSPSSELLKKI